MNAQSIKDEPLDFIGVTVTCWHCGGDGKQRDGFGECGWRDGTGQMIVARLVPVRIAVQDGRREPGQGWQEA